MPPPVVPAVMHDKAPSKMAPYDDATQKEAYPLMRRHPRGGKSLKNESLGWLLHAFNKFKLNSSDNRPRSIYQYSSKAPRLSGPNCKFFKLLLSLIYQKMLGYKENSTKYRSLTWKPRSHVRIFIDLQSWQNYIYRGSKVSVPGMCALSLR